MYCTLYSRNSTAWIVFPFSETCIRKLRRSDLHAQSFCFSTTRVGPQWRYSLSLRMPINPNRVNCRKYSPVASAWKRPWESSTWAVKTTAGENLTNSKSSDLPPSFFGLQNQELLQAFFTSIWDSQDLPYMPVSVLILFDSSSMLPTTRSNSVSWEVVQLLEIETYSLTFVSILFFFPSWSIRCHRHVYFSICPSQRLGYLSPFVCVVTTTATYLNTNYPTPTNQQQWL